MRIGSNPEANKTIQRDSYHRIIVPVFVPSLTGYFENALEVTRMCIESLIITRHGKSALTVVNNGSCQAVTSYLQELYQKGLIDQLIHNKINQGKIDAVLPIARTCSEPLVTITDGDVLFKSGWMQAVEEVYQHFPEAGMVSPVPHGTVYANYTTNTLFDAFFKGMLKFEQACNAEDMLRFAESIGKRETMYKKAIRLKYQLIVKRGSAKAVVGCGHFVSTLRKEVFDFAPKALSSLAYASKADRQYIDIPNEKAGLWRLATTGNYAYHMGNNPQDWMREEWKMLSEDKSSFTTLSKAIYLTVPLFLKLFIVRTILKKPLRPQWFKYIGLPTDYSIY